MVFCQQKGFKVLSVHTHTQISMFPKAQPILYFGFLLVLLLHEHNTFAISFSWIEFQKKKERKKERKKRGS